MTSHATQPVCSALLSLQAYELTTFPALLVADFLLGFANGRHYQEDRSREEEKTSSLDLQEKSLLTVAAEEQNTCGLKHP
jgi:hypothetical protein